MGKTWTLMCSVLVGWMLVGFIQNPALAADDPSIKGPIRENVQASMSNYVKDKTVDGVFPIYDPVDDKVLKLTFKELHKGIVKKGDYYVSCADFTGADGKKFDIDFLALPDGEKINTVQAIVHKVEDKKRPYNLEEK